MAIVAQTVSRFVLPSIAALTVALHLARNNRYAQRRIATGRFSDQAAFPRMAEEAPRRLDNSLSLLQIARK